MLFIHLGRPPTAVGNVFKTLEAAGLALKPSNVAWTHADRTRILFFLLLPILLPLRLLLAAAAVAVAAAATALLSFCLCRCETQPRADHAIVRASRGTPPASDYPIGAQEAAGGRTPRGRDKGCRGGRQEKYGDCREDQRLLAAHVRAGLVWIARFFSCTVLFCEKTFFFFSFSMTTIQLNYVRC